ncbi:hypothetical protein DNL40_07030 [Xylanimonas oleitrophica]|uniref:GIY-YIG domain-containing protein n=1 Tax=Xylanimonas oleitrophica TaxID=2607479 RepID=A0A2W5WSP8_9MICO|nr:GIY-YIG nuclease family protein [Xylanimonas oleitrophica]PZR53852.1 hypothetical protein DNL40_07030 [Xylanimonas oleitrophica]
MPESAYYVYLLRDPRIADPRSSIFYVGKGKRQRALDHELNAWAVLADDVNASVKERTLHKIRELGASVQITVLADADQGLLSEARAFDIEAGIIAALGMKGRGNEVDGHRIRAIDGTAFERIANATEQELDEKRRYIRVPVDGLWGGTDLTGTLISASDSAVWENSRQLWSKTARRRVDEIRAAGHDERVVLIALAPNPRDGRKPLVVGLWELVDAREQEGSTKESGQPGWEYVKSAVESDWLVSQRHRLLGNIATIDGKPVQRTQDRSYLFWS